MFSRQNSQAPVSETPEPDATAQDVIVQDVIVQDDAPNLAPNISADKNDAANHSATTFRETAFQPVNFKSLRSSVEKPSDLDSMNPDSMNPDSMNPDSMDLDSTNIDQSAGRFLSQIEATPVARVRRSVPKAFYAVAPSVLLLGLGLVARENASLTPFLSSSPQTSSTRYSVLRMEDGHAILSASQTLVVPAVLSAANAPSLNSSAVNVKPLASILWRARLQPIVDVVGRAPISGQITRVWVKPGQSVSTGDRVLRIMSYEQGVRSVPLPRSSADSSAEREQVQAARAQGELGQRLTTAQSQLQAAQSRVKRAQLRVDEAMSIVRQLQSGAQSDIEYSNEAETSEEAASNASNPNAAADVQAAQAAAERATQNAENARGEADVLARDAARAESEAADKTRRARELNQTRERELSRIATAKASVKAASKTDASDALSNSANGDAAPAPKASISSEAPSVSSASVAEADSAAREANNRAKSLRSRAREANSAAEKAQSRAQSASSRAKDALRSLQLFSDEARVQPRKRSTPKRSAKRNLPSVQEASQMVREATSESRQASREAERWKNEVDDYSRQARRTQQRIAASEQNLDSAQQQEQQQELDTTLQRNLSIVRAPAQGTVLQVGDVGDSVSFGDSIMQVGKQNLLRAQFSDTSGMWRKLKPGASLPSVVTLLKPNQTSSTRSIATANADVKTVRVNARIEAIEKPAKGSASAIVRTVVSASFIAPPVTPSVADSPATDNNAPNAARRVRLRAGMTIVASLDANNVTTQATSTGFESGEFAVPQSAFVALGEADATLNTSTRNEEVAASGKTRGWVAVLQPDLNGDFLIEWREVEARNQVENLNTEAQNAVAQRTIFGLQPGERIALEAAPLRDLTVKYGLDAKVRLQEEDKLIENNA